MADYKTMTLGECARYDHTTKARERLTGWGIICRDRQARGISRSARIRAKGRVMIYHYSLVSCGVRGNVTNSAAHVTCPKCKGLMA